jgi:esterase/lipase superfamily enzyme
LFSTGPEKPPGGRSTGSRFYDLFGLSVFRPDMPADQELCLKEEYHKWYTTHLSRDFEMLVFGHAGCPVILFPTSMGKFYQNKDFKLIESAAWFLDNGLIKIYCPDSVDQDSWYNRSIHPADRVKTHIGYENLILYDVIPRACGETGRAQVATAGCSFGGYHAVNLALRHPDRVGYVFTMGGAFDIKQFTDGYYDDNIYFNNPIDYMPGLNDPWYLDRIRQMGIVLGTGEWDFCLDDNIRLSNALNSKGIGHWLDLRSQTGHDWPWWREMFPHYLTKIKQE